MRRKYVSHNESVNNEWYLVLIFTQCLGNFCGSERCHHRRRIKTEEKTKVLAVVWGDGIDSVPCHTTYVAIFQQDDLKKILKKIMNRITAPWLTKMDYHPVHTIPNHHPIIMDVLPKTFLEITFAANS